MSSARAEAGSGAAASSQGLLEVGQVARAHGVRGRVLVVPYNADSAGLERVPALWLRSASAGLRRFEVGRAERAHLGYLVALRGIEDRDAAQALRGSTALIDRKDLPAPEPGEMYVDDMVGMTVVDRGGSVRGEVVGFESAGANQLLLVQCGTRVVLVPFGLLFEVDEAARRIAIEAPEGLFELEE